MTTTNRRIISILLSLLLVMSGPALAISAIAGGQADTAMADCGSMMMDQMASASSQSDDGSDCVLSSDMTCSSANGLGKCGTSFALFQANPTGLTDTSSPPVSIARAAHYQAPFLASITPPPERHS